MADEAAHIAIANRNQQTINYLCAKYESHSAWIVTIAFYKALHVVEAVFFNDPKIEHTGDHAQRFTRLKRIRKYKHLFEHYSPLWRASNVARYLEDNRVGEFSCFDEYIPPRKALDTFLFDHLKQIEKSARKCLKNPDKLLGVDTAKDVVKEAASSTQDGTVS